VWEQVEAEYACLHECREVRYSFAANGARQYREQCLACGELSQFLKYSHPRVMALVEPNPVDEALREAYQQAIRLEAQRRITEQHDLDTMARLRERDEQETEFWVKYNAYLKSGEWRERRRLVLQRDGYLCQACLQAEASQVHHLTYDHVFAEPLFDLRAVCQSCHERITVLDRERRRGAA